METVENVNDAVVRADVERLLRPREGPCVSILMPIRRDAAEATLILLRNLLREAEERLAAAGVPAARAKRLLAPVARLAAGSGSRRLKRGEGLALYVAAGEFLAYPIAAPPEPVVVVGSRFYVRPLVPLLSGNLRFYLLTLTKGSVRLYDANRYELKPVKLDAPTSLAEALQLDEMENQLQVHTGGGRTSSGARAGIFHGQSPRAGETVKKHILRFFHELDRAVEARVAGAPAPLVLAGVPYLQGLFRQVSRQKRLLPEGVDVNPANLSRTELHRRAWALVEPRALRARLEADRAYRQTAATRPERVGRSFQAVVPAARFGRVAALFLPFDRHAWGRFDPAGGSAVVHAAPEPFDVDLADVAVEDTLLHDGAVYLLTPEDMPDDAPVAALYRY